MDDISDLSSLDGYQRSDRNGSRVVGGGAQRRSPRPLEAAAHLEDSLTLARSRRLRSLRRHTRSPVSSVDSNPEDHTYATPPPPPLPFADDETSSVTDKSLYASETDVEGPPASGTGPLTATGLSALPTVSTWPAPFSLGNAAARTVHDEVSVAFAPLPNGTGAAQVTSGSTLFSISAAAAGLVPAATRASGDREGLRPNTTAQADGYREGGRRWLDELTLDALSPLLAPRNAEFTSTSPTSPLAMSLFSTGAEVWTGSPAQTTPSLHSATQGRFLDWAEVLSEQPLSRESHHRHSVNRVLIGSRDVVSRVPAQRAVPRRGGSVGMRSPPMRPRRAASGGSSPDAPLFSLPPPLLPRPQRSSTAETTWYSSHERLTQLSHRALDTGARHNGFLHDVSFYDSPAMTWPSPSTSTSRNVLEQATAALSLELNEFAPPPPASSDSERFGFVLRRDSPLRLTPLPLSSLHDPLSQASTPSTNGARQGPLTDLNEPADSPRRG